MYHDAMNSEWSTNTRIPKLAFLSVSDQESPRRYSIASLRFEKDLLLSGVYRRAKRSTMDFSFRSSIVRTHAWSLYSGISLSKISELSVVALPLYPDNLVHSSQYQFGNLDEGGEVTIESVVFSERCYLAHLDQLQKCIAGTGWTSAFTDEVPKLITTEREFLSSCELLESVAWADQPWDIVFREWALDATTSYARLVKGEHSAREVLGFILRDAQTADIGAVQSTRAALELLSIPAKRLKERRAWVQRLLTTAHPCAARAASCLKIVEAAAETALESGQLERLYQLLHDSLTAPEQRELRGSGDILLFANLPPLGITPGSVFEAQQPHDVYLCRNALVVVEVPSKTKSSAHHFRKLSLVKSTPRLARGRRLSKIIRSTAVTSVISEGKCGVKLTLNQQDIVGGNWLILRLPDLATQEKWLSVLGNNLSGTRNWGPFSIASIGTVTDDEQAFRNKFAAMVDNSLEPITSGRIMGWKSVDRVRTRFNVHGAVFLDGSPVPIMSCDIILGHEDGYILLYNVADHSSFAKIEYLYESTAGNDEDNCPSVLVGLQSANGVRVVSEKEGQDLAVKLGIGFFEADLGTGHNVKDAFFAVVREIRRRMWVRQP